MSSSIVFGIPPIEVHIRRLPRAKRYSLRVSNADGRVNLTIPARAPLDDALDFAKRQEAWLRQTLEKQPERIKPSFGSHFQLQDRQMLLVQGRGRQVRITGDRIEVPGDETVLAAKLRGFCKVQARQQLAHRSEAYAARIGRQISKITLRDTRSRWGSCTADGQLMYSWRLIMAPAEVLDYVVAHEVAHLVELNHSRKFWQQVEMLKPDYEIHRRWLKANGSTLHRYLI